jgi:hypothetical protein
MNVCAIKWVCLILFLTGCASDPVAEQKQAAQLMERKIQVYGPACEILGYEKDADAWRECIQREYEQTVIRQQYQWNYPYPYWSPYYGPHYYHP